MNTQIKNSAFLPVNSPEYKAFIGVGFRFENLKLKNGHLYGRLVCLCGAVENINIPRHIISSKPLKELGSYYFNRWLNTFLLDDAHLLEDGYTPEQIQEIRKRYNDLHKHAPHR
jgi:hypothetical protein